MTPARWFPRRAQVQVVGDPALATLVLEELTAAGWRAELLAEADLPSARLAPTLVLAAPVAPAALLARVAERSPAGRQRPRPRVILMHRDAPPALPESLTSGFELDLFAIEARAARALLATWPPHAGFDPPFGQRPHLLIAGSAPPARAVLIQALRLLHYGPEPPLLTLLDADPVSLADWLQRSHPQASRIAEIQRAALADWSPAARPPVNLALIASADAPSGRLALAGRIRDRLAADSGVFPPLLLEMGVVRSSGTLDNWDGQLVPVSLTRLACTPEVLLDPAGDAVACAIHAHYLDSLFAQGRDAAREPAGRPWSRLAASYREANRQQADHIAAKLAVADCRALADGRGSAFAFTPLEVERLARIEHRRWAADRYLDGWTYAPERDNARRHHPQLVPFAALSGPMQDLDRFAVRSVPALLARSGQGVLRRLILAVRDPAGPGCLVPPERCFKGVAARLAARYPDRALTVASTLGSNAARAFVAALNAHLPLELFWLQPPGAAVPPTELAARRALLTLAVRASRRIALADDAELARWQSERATIIVDFAAAAADVLLAEPGKRLVIDPQRGAFWNFEY